MQLIWLTLGLAPLVTLTILKPSEPPRVAGILLSPQNLQRLLIAGMVSDLRIFTNYFPFFSCWV